MKLFALTLIGVLTCSPARAQLGVSGLPDIAGLSLLPVTVPTASLLGGSAPATFVPIVVGSGLQLTNQTLSLNATCELLTDSGTACLANTGISGHTLPFLDGANTWSGTQTFAGVIGRVVTQAGTSCTLNSTCSSNATDCGTVILFTANSTITVTVPATLPVGCNIALSQVGTGQVSIAAGAGATVYSSHSYTKTSGQHAVIGLSVETNAGGSAANVNLLGDGST